MNGLPKEFQKDKYLRGMKITKEEYKCIRQSINKYVYRRKAERFSYISGWYPGKKSKEYLKAVGRKDINWFKNNCRCFLNEKIECPSCQMLRLFKKYGDI
jgi:hypothetical protein